MATEILTAPGVVPQRLDFRDEALDDFDTVDSQVNTSNDGHEEGHRLALAVAHLHHFSGGNTMEHFEVLEHSL